MKIWKKKYVVNVENAEREEKKAKKERDCKTADALGGIHQTVGWSFHYGLDVCNYPYNVLLPTTLCENKRK